MYEFDKETFVSVSMECIERQGIDPAKMAKDLGVSKKTLGYYLDVERSELPKLPLFVLWFQYLGSSPSKLLIGRGPNNIDAYSAMKVYELLDEMTASDKPAYLSILRILKRMRYQEVEQLRRHLQLYMKDLGR